MAPEKLAGRRRRFERHLRARPDPVEIVTGRRAYEAKSLADLKKLQDTGTVHDPFVDRARPRSTIERVILRCIDKEAEQGPGSALAVAAALPAATAGGRTRRR